VISPLRILYLEDERKDAELVRAILEAEGIACCVTRVETESEFLTSLKPGGFDLIFADYALPSFDGISALKIAKEIRPDLPFIMVSGTAGEEVAVETLKVGATDFVLKTRLSRLVPSVQRALREAEEKARRERAEEALRRNEAYLAEAQRLSHTGSFGWQVASGQIYWSEETFRIFEFEAAAQPTFERVFERIHPEDRQLVRQVIDSAAQQRKNFDLEHRLLMPDNSVRYVRVVGHASSKDESGMLEFVGAVTDITERKRAEEALRRSEKELRDVIETMPSLAFSARPDGSGEFTTGRWREYLGLSTEETLGECGASTIYPDDRDLHLGKWRASLATGEAFENEARHRSANGEYRWFLVRAVPLRDEHGRVFKWYGSLTDIEDRKRAEALLTGEKRILEMVAKGDPLAQILDTLCRLVEEQASGVLASILLVDGDRLRHGGAPSLPKAYTEAIDGVVIGPSVGSCGTAAYRGEQVIVEDIATDPLWADYRVAALPHSLRACWSTPVFSPQGKVIGTFAMYYRETRSPNLRDQEIIEQITHLAGVAIERKLTQEALRRSESYLAEAQRLTKTGSWAFKPLTGQTIYWSEEMFRIFGFDAQQRASTSEAFWGRVHPEDRDSTYELIRKAVLEKAEYEHDHRIVLPDGTVKHIHALGHPLLNAAGEVVEYIGTSIDVTERKRAVEELRRSEAYLAESQRLTKTGSWAYNSFTGKTLYWSEEMFRIFGLSPAEGPSSEKFWELVHPEDLERVRERVESEAHGKTEYVDEYRIVLSDGTVKHVLDIGRAVCNNAGEVVEFVGTTVDVTERKRAEEEARAAETRFRASVDHLTDALFIHDDQDDQGRVMDVNQQACDSLGYTREELIGMTAFDYDAFVDATFMQSIKERVARGESFSFESVHRRKDGTTFPVEVRARPFWHGDHRFGLALVRDITDRKRAEQERERLRHLEAELARINRVSVMGELTASLAHEIKQPIAAAGTNAAACLRLLEGDHPDIVEAREAASGMIGCVSRTAKIIDRVRSLFEKSAPQWEPVNINEVIREIGLLLRNEVRRYSVAIYLELENLPTVMGDRVQLQQVFMNLMLNAIEAMKDAGGELTVKSQLADDDQLQISISDTGVGLPADKADQLFNAFFTTKPQGTGMGLAITRSIIEAHRGRVWASANRGRGATFYFTLPTEATASSTSAA
jgi:PAS domain S-box-containing protein